MTGKAIERSQNNKKTKLISPQFIKKSAALMVGKWVFNSTKKVTVFFETLHILSYKVFN